MNQFTEHYKTLSNPDLLKIIDNAGDYQPLAVDAAKIELAERHLSNDELENATAEIESEKQEAKLKEEKKTACENKVKDISSSFIDTIHPIRTSPTSTGRMINTICVVFGIFFLIEFFNQLGLIKFMLTDGQARWNFGEIFYFFPLILGPTAIFLFWRRRKKGWILFCIYCTYFSSGAIVLFLVSLRHRFSVPVLDNLLPPTSAVSFIRTMFFFGVCLWFIYKKTILEIYAIDKRTLFTTTAIGIGLTVFQYVSTFGL